MRKNTIALDTASGRIHAYLRTPSDHTTCGLVIFDQTPDNEEIRLETVDRWAEEEYAVLVPKLPAAGTEVGPTDLFIAEIVDGFRALLGPDARIAIMGYGAWALSAVSSAMKGSACGAVAYWSEALGTLPPGFQENTVPMIIHSPTRERCQQPRDGASAADLLVTRSNIDIHFYLEDVTEFAYPVRGNSFKPGTDLAFTRTLAFLRRTIGPRIDLLELWERHVYYEMVTRDTRATLSTMVENPLVHIVPTDTGGAGYEMLARFYKYHFVDANPEMEITLISRTIGPNRLVEEFVCSFTHDREIPWMLPGVPPTGKHVIVPWIGIITFRGRRLANEHIYWDHASLLKQLGFHNFEGLPVAGADAAIRLMDGRPPTNALMSSWKESAGKSAP